MNKKKRLLAWSAVFALILGCLTACGGTGGTPSESSAVSGVSGGESAAPVGQAAEYVYGYASIRLTVPEGWEFEMLDGEEGGLRFWPISAPDGRILLSFHPDGFDAGATGLEIQSLALADGATATIGAYVTEPHPYWGFLLFDDAPGVYVATTEGVYDWWWIEFGDTVMQILNGARLGEGYLTRTAAIEAAKPACTVAFDQTAATFDGHTGEWAVHFYTAGQAGGDQTVFLAPDGSVMGISGGE